MTHVSKHTVSDKTRSDMQRLVFDLLVNTGTGTRQKVLEELLTPTERVMLTKRILLLKMIESEIPTHSIARTLKMSPSTVARFEQQLARGKYSHTKKWLRRSHVGSQTVKIIESLLALPFDALTKSRSELLRE